VLITVHHTHWWTQPYYGIYGGSFGLSNLSSLQQSSPLQALQSSLTSPTIFDSGTHTHEVAN